MARMFMLYDCQPYSANLTTKLIKYLSKFSKNKFQEDSGQDGVIIVKDGINTQINYLESMSNFLRTLNAQPLTKETKEKITFLMNNKAKITKLEKELGEKGRKGITKLMQSYIGEDEDRLAFKLSEFLLYSRLIHVESILELIGDKREAKLLWEYMKKFQPLIYNLNVEQALRKFFTSFRLAGVESQTVERVLEQFGHFYFEYCETFTREDGIIKFANKAEAFDFVYLLLMLHTCHHNPNLVNKTNFKWYLDSVKDMCKESYPNMEEKDLREIFDSIEITEYDSPSSRNLYDKPFSLECMPIELYVRTQVKDKDAAEFKEADFINSMLFDCDKKLFHYHNNFEVPEPLISLSKTYIAELIFQDIKQLLTENIDSENFVVIFDKVFIICSEFGRVDILEEIMNSMYAKVQWNKYYEELTDMELNMCSCLIIYLCKWVARFKSLSPNVSTILIFAYENVSLRTFTYIGSFGGCK
jgi:hypothetical protein